MFQKPYKTKGQTPLKTSDKKKLRQRVASQLKQTDPENLGISTAKNANLTSAKIITASNDQLTVYFEENDPILIETRGGVLIPTMYLLAKNPNLVDSLNVFGIHPGIIDKLQKGADLMAPGMVKNKSNFLKKLDKNDYIFLRIVVDSPNSESGEKTSSPILAIGQCLMASHEMVSYNLSAGRFAKIIHIIDDKLWQAGSQKIDTELASKLCIEAHPWVDDKNELDDQEFPKIGELAQELVHDQENTEDVPEAEPEQINENNENCVIEGEEDNEAESISESEIYDKILINALLHCLKTEFSKKPNERPQLPILNSTFYSKYIMPLILLPEEQETFNLKMTSFKNLPKFLDYCQEELNLLKTITNEKSHILISSVQDANSSKLVKNFKIPKNPSEINAANFDPNQKILPGQPTSAPVTSSFFLVTNPAVPILKCPKNTTLKNSEVREKLIEYLKTEDLLLSGGECSMDPALAAFTQIKELTCSMKLLNERFNNRLTVKTMISYAGRAIDNSLKNTLPNLKIDVLNRGGNKKITQISGFEFFHLDIQAFAKALKLRVQASCQIDDLSSNEASGFLKSGMKDLNKSEMKFVTIQGDQVKVLKKFLEDEYFLGLRFLKIQEKQKKAGKKGGKK